MAFSSLKLKGKGASVVHLSSIRHLFYFTSILTEQMLYLTCEEKRVLGRQRLPIPYALYVLRKQRGNCGPRLREVDRNFPHIRKS
jgi:hypothetical protein